MHSTTAADWLGGSAVAVQLQTSLQVCAEVGWWCWDFVQGRWKGCPDFSKTAVFG